MIGHESDSVPRKKPEPLDVGLNRVVLEPVTKIMRFEGIQWEVQKVVTGAIAGLLFGDNKEQKKSFYKSAVSRRNKETLLQLASQVYSYLDGTISEFADIDDYVFRVLTRVTVNKTDGRIVADPLFDVEIYKHFGKVSAKGVESKEYLNVLFIGGIGDQFIGPRMVKVLNKAVQEFKFIKFVPYKDPRAAPATVRTQAINNSPTLVIGDNAFAVKLKAAEDGTNFIYIDDGGNDFPITDEKDIVVFLSKKSGLKPDILRTATAFDSVERMDREIRDISKTIMGNVSEGAMEVELIESIGLDEAIGNLEQSLNLLKKRRLSDNMVAEVKDMERELVSAKKDYSRLRVDYEVASNELSNIEEKWKSNQITFEQYEVERWKILRSQGLTREKLVNLQANVKGVLTSRIYALISKPEPMEKAK
jgi:hypothetical protein